jgi:hypothetical protein
LAKNAWRKTQKKSLVRSFDPEAGVSRFDLIARLALRLLPVLPARLGETGAIGKCLFVTQDDPSSRYFSRLPVIR